MNEKRQCQNCKQEFTIEAEDFGFYKKIDVPAPTWCSLCRSVRRMAFSNERTLYKRKCDLCEKEGIAIYDKDTPFPVYCIDCWRSDKWDPTSYGQEYDFKKPFFEQLAELKNKVPRAALIQQGDMTGSEYTNRASNNKNCYLLFRANFNENLLYSHTINDAKDSSDCLALQQSELCYECIDCSKCYNLQYSQECRECRDSMFLYDCRNCTNCFGSVNLRNAQYHIFNEPYSKEEYEKKIKSFAVDNFASLEMMRQKFHEFNKKFIREFMVSTRAERSTGNWIYDSKNVRNSYFCRGVEDGAHLFGIIEAKDCMDYLYWGRSCELVYETANCGYNSSRIFFCNLTYTSCSDLQYSDHCISSRNCFGSVGLKNGEFCVLNKKYDEKSFGELKAKIIKHMDEMPYTDKQGRLFKYGEFFPLELSEFAYNETAAHDYFPLEKEEALKQGFTWKEIEERKYNITVPAEELPMTIGETDDDILKEVISCEHEGKCNENCITAFKITSQELAFYRRLGIPLPRLCHNCRHQRRLKYRNPPQLWSRQCMCDHQVYKNTAEHPHHPEGRCPNEFETSYSLDRKEIVYCEECYQAEVI